MKKNGMRPVPPGEILKDEFLKPLSLTANAAQLSKRATLFVIRNPLNDLNPSAPLRAGSA